MVGAYNEASAATGIDGDQLDNSVDGAGAAYVFARSGATWSQQAYLKPSVTAQGAYFGQHIAMSSDGTTVAISAAAAQNGAGIVYVFVQAQGTWTQQAALHASNADPADGFGDALAISANGDTLAIGAPNEASAANTINGDQANNLAFQNGAVYVFSRSGGTWTQQAYVKSSQANAGQQFGAAVALSDTGDVLAAGAPLVAMESIGVTTIFTRAADVWSERARIAPPHNGGTAAALALSGDGQTLVVGAAGDDSSSQGVGASDLDFNAMNSGAVYVYTGSGATWTQQNYIKASNADAGDLFGRTIAVSNDGSTLLVGAPSEASSATLFDGDGTSNADPTAGAAYLFHRSANVWSQTHYIKASNTDSMDQFGNGVAISGDGSTIAVTAYGEASAAQGIGGDQTDNSAIGAGAAYIFQ